MDRGTEALTKKTFFAQQWLQKEIESVPDLKGKVTPPPSLMTPVRNRFPTFTHQKRQIVRQLESDKFSPLHCFVPGWKGDSLQSKNIWRVELLLNTIEQDIRNELFKTKDFPRTIKIGLYNEFLSYAESLGLHFDGMDDLSGFWQQITPEKLAENDHLFRFINIYANRVATITFLKLRFIATMIERCGLELNDKALLYPTAFLSQLFKKGSQTELNSRALESNIYSWYRPHEGMKGIMKELLTLSKSLNITEINKTISVRTQVQQDQGKVYSHALSHLSFGLFLNSLQINYPIWLETIENKSIPNGSLEQEQIISCKYFGDYLESLSLSHWLAQENNRDFRWYEMLCPDFKGLEFISGTFAKVCNELHFLTFLAEKSEHQGERPIDYICRIIGGHFRNRKNAQFKQGFLLNDNPFYTSTYDRVVLNLCHFPKNNPQHYLMTQIMDQVKYLKPNGYLFVLSSKKLFVPSLRERLEPVLKELKTEAIFDFENVKGKGELGSYIYIFRKKQPHDDRQLCSYFRISADLENFQQFASITEHLRSFYLSHLNEVPAMAHLDFSDSFRVEFYQEAVVNGMLIHSTNEDSNRITHPTFFKGLLESCVPFDTLFEIRPLTALEKISTFDQGLNLGLKRDLSYFLVVNFKGPEAVLELHPMETFRSIHSEYGETQCSYFQLQPKLAGLNPNILRNYFLTPIGKQVTALTFTGGLSLVKGSLSKFLIPKFLTETEGLPDHLRSGLKMLEMNENELLETNPMVIVKSFQHIDQISKTLFPRYACEILSRFSNFENTLQSLIWKMEDARFGHKISFNNPVLQAQLVQKPTQLLFPNNDDIHVEMVDSENPSNIHLPLTQTHIRMIHEGELKLYSLELISGDRVIVRLNAEEPMVLFINFILSQALNIPISKLLRAVHVPSYKNLKEIIEFSQSFKTNYQELLKSVQGSIMNAFRLQVISHKRPQ